MSESVFLYDFNSPYAYLAASRIERILGPAVRWQPVAFAFMLRASGRTPWSFGEGHDRGVRECEGRALRYGLPALRWPPGWPVDSYSLLPLRAALVAEESGRLREFSLSAFAENFVHGKSLERDGVRRAARRAGLDPDVVCERSESPEVKHRLRSATDDALAAGAIGVPTLLIDGEVYWGDDRMPEAAARLRQRPATEAY